VLAIAALILVAAVPVVVAGDRLGMFAGDHPRTPKPLSSSAPAQPLR
jgi:hypothetical protein